MKSWSLNFLEPSGPRQAYNGTALPFTLIPKLVNILRDHEIFSLFSSTEAQMWQLPASRLSASELYLIDQARTNGAVPLSASKTSLDKETPFQTEVTVENPTIHCPSIHYCFMNCYLICPLSCH